LDFLLYFAENQCRRPYKRSVNFGWGDEKVRGLNIGGWLVLEPWITPSIFQSLDPSLGIVDEFTLTQKLGTEAALNILQPHVSPRQQMAIIYNTLIVGFVVQTRRFSKDCRCWIQYRQNTDWVLGLLARCRRKLHTRSCILHG
jgi:hypothetical protein